MQEPMMPSSWRDHPCAVSFCQPHRHNGTIRAPYCLPTRPKCIIVSLKCVRLGFGVAGLESQWQCKGHDGHGHQFRRPWQSIWREKLPMHESDTSCSHGDPLPLPAPGSRGELVSLRNRSLGKPRMHDC